MLKVRLGWLPLIQLLIASLLLAGGAWLHADSVYGEKVLRASAVLKPHTVRPLPALPFTFPDGSRKLFPGQRMVALYGTPGAPVLGALGQQGTMATIHRVKNLSRQYQPYSKERILPTLEIIATIASAFPTENNDYSRPVSPQVLQTWITAAREAGVYVVLDLQPGRTDFLTQARQLRPLLLQPNVGLALDPEWRLKPQQVPLVQIGTVSIGEVNAVNNWLAALTRQNHLPQKLFLLHQFRLDMLPLRHNLDTSHPELAYAIQMDGQGSQSEKQHTWHAILHTPPTNTKFGWKNFYHKDTRLLTPAETMQITPKPWYVSYQ